MSFPRAGCIGVLFLAITTMPLDIAHAMPAFARQYNVSCVVCHDAFQFIGYQGGTAILMAAFAVLLPLLHCSM